MSDHPQPSGNNMYQPTWPRDARYTHQNPAQYPPTGRVHPPQPMPYATMAPAPISMVAPASYQQPNSVYAPSTDSAHPHMPHQPYPPQRLTIPPSQSPTQHREAPTSPPYHTQTPDYHSSRGPHTSNIPYAASQYGSPSSPSSQFPASPQRPYACDLCPLSFNRQHDLKRHRDTHTGEKPFECSGGCGKTFTRKDALKRHQLVKRCGMVDDA